MIKTECDENKVAAVKTGAIIPYKDTELSLVEWKCPVCMHRWWEYSDYEEYPELCPLCGSWLNIEKEQQNKEDNKVSNMNRLNVTVNALAVYNSSILVPEDLTIDEAIEYAKAHMDEIPMSALEYVGDAGLDEDNCDFAEESEPESVSSFR